MLFILIGLLISVCSASSETNQIVLGPEVCNFYKDFEKAFNCGPNGFFIKSGLRYCNRFYDPSKSLNVHSSIFF